MKYLQKQATFDATNLPTPYVVLSEDDNAIHYGSKNNVRTFDLYMVNGEELELISGDVNYATEPITYKECNFPLTIEGDRGVYYLTDFLSEGYIYVNKSSSELSDSNNELLIAIYYPDSSGEMIIYEDGGQYAAQNIRY